MAKSYRDRSPELFALQTAAYENKVFTLSLGCIMNLLGAAWREQSDASPMMQLFDFFLNMLIFPALQ